MNKHETGEENDNLNPDDEAGSQKRLTDKIKEGADQIKSKGREVIKGKEITKEVLKSAIGEAYSSIDKSGMAEAAVSSVNGQLDEFCEMALKGFRVGLVEGGMFSPKAVVDYMDLSAAVLKRAAEILNKDYNTKNISTTARSLEKANSNDRSYVKEQARDKKIKELTGKLKKTGSDIVGGLKNSIGRGE